MQANDGTVVPEPLRTHSALAMRHVAPTHQYSYQLKYHMLKPHATLGTKYIDFRECGYMWKDDMRRQRIKGRSDLAAGDRRA